MEIVGTGYEFAHKDDYQRTMEYVKEGTLIFDDVTGHELEQFIETLGKRAEKVAARAVSPSEDNMLTISTDGRKAALDIRMVDDAAIPTSVPLAVVADHIARIHREHQDDVFTDPRTGPVAGYRRQVEHAHGRQQSRLAHRWCPPSCGARRGKD